MAPNDQELRPCPFCGGEAAFIADTKTIKCKSCGGAFICTNPLISTLEAAAAWNRRPGQTRVEMGRNLGADTPSRFECSVCGWTDWDTYTADSDVYNYCPGCGAKMDGREKCD